MVAVRRGEPLGAPEIPDEVARPRHIGRWVAVVVLLLFAAGFGHALAKNPQVEWSIIGKYLFDRQILAGLRQTATLAVIAMVFAILVGAIVGFLRLSRNPVVSTLCWLYVWIFRSVPTLIQLLFWGNLALFASSIGVSIPGTSVSLFSVKTNSLLPPFIASIVALALANGSYLAEIVRSGILSVDQGQRLAASALGLRWWQVQRTIILPQALRVIIPPAGNQFITLLKETSLVSVIAGGDLLTQAENISGSNLRTIELLTVAALWYLVVTSLASALQFRFERRAGRGQAGPVRRASTRVRSAGSEWTESTR